MLGLSERSVLAGNAIEQGDEIAERLVKSGKEVIRLNRGDPAAYFRTPRDIIRSSIRALREGKTGYSYPGGVLELREAISSRQKRLYGLDASPDQIVITQGVSEAIIFLNSMLINPRDRAVVLRPYYPLYVPALQMEGGVPVYADYEEGAEGRVDPDRLRKALSKARGRAKYMIFANPSNPLGTVMGRKEMSELAEVAKDNDLLIISDEIYDEIVYNGAKFTSMSEVSKGIPAVILGGASKSFDATGFRIGYAVIPDCGKYSVGLAAKLTDYAKMRLCSNTPAQYAFAEAVNDKAQHARDTARMVREIERRTNLATDLVNESEYMEAQRPSGAFYVFPRLDMDALRLSSDAELVMKLLEEEYVHVTGGSGFGSPGRIRIVSLAPEETIRRAVRKIDKFLARYSK